MVSFMDRLTNIFQNHSQLCVGIDPSDSELENWDLLNSAVGAREYGFRIIDAASGQVGIVKPQVSFFERFGSAGYLALEEVLIRARQADLLVIADAKRGDIGSTMFGYAQAWFGDDSPLRSDALTVSGYLGPSSLLETLDYARDVNGGLFMLAATSNPEAKEIQNAQINGESVACSVIRAAQKLGNGDLGVVIGATQNFAELGIEFLQAEDIQVPILAPGFGAQGGNLESLKKIFGASSPRVVANVSRDITQHGIAGLSDQIQKLRDRL
jgi:orotidine-5'-phosphate decarboxylase